MDKFWKVEKDGKEVKVYGNRWQAVEHKKRDPDVRIYEITYVNNNNFIKKEVNI